MEINWKKKYNEALEKIKRYTIDKYGCTRLKPADIFPELSEDDERMKKAIIDALNSHNNSINLLSSRGYSMDDVISYLEKKEQQEVNCDFYNKELSDIVSAELYKYSGPNSIKSPWALDSTGVQYPLYFANLGAKWQKKQKSGEWNKEDERIRKALISLVDENAYTYKSFAGVDLYSMLAYLEKQKMEGNFRCAKVNDEPIPSEPHSVNLPKGVEINGVPESEDERARMWLYDYIFNCPNENFAFYGGVGKQAVLAWLEKQKDNKFAPRVLPCSAAWFEDGEERQKEQKPKNILTNDDSLQTAYLKGQTDVLEDPEAYGLQKEQKPAEWSEVELEFRGEKVKVKRPFFRDDKGRGYSTTEQDEDVAWDALRAWCEKKGISLYDLYPKAEWSEEDEKIQEGIMQFLFAWRSDAKITKWLDWLKSLQKRFSYQTK